MKTLKQMADELGVPKQRLYRFVKQAGITEVHQENKTMYYDETAEMTIKAVFKSSDVHHDETLDTPNDADDVHQNSSDVHHDTGEVHHNETPDTSNDADDVHQKRYDVHHDVLLETQKHDEKIIEVLQNTYQKEIDSRDERIRQLQSVIEQLQSELMIERQHNREVTDSLTQLSDKFAQLADQAQRLQLMQMQPPMLPDSDEDEHNQKPSFWKRIFRRNG